MKLSLGQKIGSGFVAALVMLFVIGVFSYSSTTRLLANAEWVAHTHQVLENLESLLASASDAEAGARSYYLTGEDPYLEPYRAAVEQVPAEFRTLRALTADNPKQQRRLDVLEPLLNRKLALVKDTVELRREHSLAAFVRLVQAGTTGMDQIREVVREMENEERGLLIQREAGAKASGKTTIEAILLASLLSLLLVALSGFIIHREIQNSRRAEEMKRTQAEEIAELYKRLNEGLGRRSAELEAANKELEAFTYSVSHDLRAPLRHIDGFSKLLLEEASSGLSEDARGYLQDIREGTEEMGRLVDDLLALARVGRKELVLQATGLGTLADQAVMELKRANVGRAIEWKIGKLPFVECDPGLVKQVFVNLLSNAVKFTRPREVAEIEVGATTNNGQPAFFVRDNGVGFNMKNAGKLFGVFQRLHRQEDFEGTGVGLATVQRIVHKHSGQVWAEAELDRGATFFFTLGSTLGGVTP
jgi:signal transduction histidine kinase